MTPIVLNATPEAFSAGTSSLEKLLPQMVPEATQSPPDLIKDEVSEPELEFSDSKPEGM